MRWLLLLLAALILPMTAAPARSGDTGETGRLAGKRVLIFTHSTGYRHESIGPGSEALARLIREAGGEAEIGEDPDLFRDSALRRFDAILLLSTTTDRHRPESEWLTGHRRAGLQTYLRGGGGIVAVHAAADSHYHWPWYGETIGGRFQRHPPGTPRGSLRVVDGDHPSTEALPSETSLEDEWYFIDGHDPEARRLVTLDPASIGESGPPVPISWAREQDGGRVFYTSLGHRTETYALPFFRAHMLGALEWAMAERP